MDKPPYDVKTGMISDITNPSTWVSFDRAYEEYKTNRYDGIGFALAKEYTGFDFDNSRNPSNGQLSEPSLSEIKKLNSYTEVSPSQEGVKTLTRAKLPKGGHHRGGWGIFDNDRYFCITGHVIDGVSNNIEARQPEVNDYLRRFHPEDFKGIGKKPKTDSKPGSSLSSDDLELI